MITIRRFVYGIAGTLLASTLIATPAQAAEPPLRLVAGAPAVTVDRFSEPGQPVFLNFDLGTHLVAGQSPFEVKAQRKSYHDPIVATVKNKKLPAGLVTDLSGLTKFLHITLTDPAGKVVYDKDQTFCPNSEQGNWVRPDAPDTSPYPKSCGANPFTVGQLWGLQAGWSTPTADFFNAYQQIDIPEGKYTAKVSVTQAYLAALGIPAGQASATLDVTVKNVGGHPQRSPKAGKLAAAASRPTGAPSVPKGPKPDLRSLPAWAINTEHADGKDALQFAANVWNAGPSPLVLDGFRRTGEDLMDAYQYFYDDKGKQVGYAPTGTMEWDAREGHTHWHFRDFATYRLLNADQSVAVRSGKEAFCLANTDGINHLVKNANLNPGNHDLHTACGTHTALSVRQVLAVGWGDTYIRVPGQEFDLTGVPNGTYYIQVLANPEKKLYESDTTNNSSLRKVVIGGVPGARTVQVPPYELIDAP